MDTSKEYVTMCRQAGEIQEKGRETGVLASKHVFIKYVSEGCANVCVWLPRQGQLQEMLDGGYWENLCQLCDFGRSRSDIFNCANTDIFKTLEQLWLAFVMHQKYDKPWNGKEWATSLTG